MPARSRALRFAGLASLPAFATANVAEVARDAAVADIPSCNSPAGCLSLLQHASAASGSRSGRGTPILPRDTQPPVDEKAWTGPRVPDSPEVKRTETFCLNALQTSYECHFIPDVFGGPQCECMNDQEIYKSCGGWYATQMTGSWYVKQHWLDSVPKGNFTETREICDKALQQAYDCFEIPVMAGGPKGDVCDEQCQKWYHTCLGGDGSVPQPHKGTVPSL